MEFVFFSFPLFFSCFLKKGEQKCVKMDYGVFMFMARIICFINKAFLISSKEASFKDPSNRDSLKLFRAKADKFKLHEASNFHLTINYYKKKSFQN